MRLIGHLATESTARTFADYLYVLGIENQIEHESNAGWAVWISDEDKIDSAAALLTDFRANPDDPKYKAQARGAADLRAEEEKKLAAYQKRMRDRRHLFRPLSEYGFGPLTFVLIIICVLVFVLSGFGNQMARVASLFITEVTGPPLAEIRHGQLWRLVTPIFLHFNVLHILFNLLWLRDLGSMIEGRQSSRLLAVQVVTMAIASNLGQYFFAGPFFGGMSGVVYGLLGYVWMRGKFDPGSGLFVHPTTVTMMIIWFIAGYTGILGPIANTAHAVGLVCGVVWGYLSSLRYR